LRSDAEIREHMRETYDKGPLERRVAQLEEIVKHQDALLQALEARLALPANRNANAPVDVSDDDGA
jgi:hypothetical protein